jgi:hypothetical protein
MNGLLSIIFVRSTRANRPQVWSDPERAPCGGCPQTFEETTLFDEHRLITLNRAEHRCRLPGQWCLPPTRNGVGWPR